MLDSALDDLPILRELRDDLDTAYRAREAARTRPRDAQASWVAPRSPLVRGRLRARRRFVAFALTSATVVAALAVALPGGDRALSVLEAAAATAAAQPAPAAEAGTYAYFTARTTVGSTVDPTISGGGGTEWWVARDGSGRMRQTMRIDDDFERPADGVEYVVRPGDDPGLPRWRRAGDHRWVREARFGPGGFDAVHSLIAPGVLSPHVDRLPTDPHELKAALTAQLEAATRDRDPETGFRGPVREDQLLTVIEQTLAHPLTSPELRSSLYRVAATLAGVEVTEHAKDPLGRPATALVHTRDTDPGTVTTELFFDPGTAASLAARLTTTEHGTTTQTWLYTPPTTVESVDSRP